MVCVCQQAREARLVSEAEADKRRALAAAMEDARRELAAVQVGW